MFRLKIVNYLYKNLHLRDSTGFVIRLWKHCKCSKFTIKIPQRCHWHHSGVFIINFSKCSSLFIILMQRFHSKLSTGISLLWFKYFSEVFQYFLKKSFGATLTLILNSPLAMHCYNVLICSLEDKILVQIGLRQDSGKENITLSSRHLFAESQQWKHQNNLWNL